MAFVAYASRLTRVAGIAIGSLAPLSQSNRLRGANKPNPYGPGTNQLSEHSQASEARCQPAKRVQPGACSQARAARRVRLGVSEPSACGPTPASQTSGAERGRDGSGPGTGAPLGTFVPCCGGFQAEIMT